jgi:hypothetical protein
MACAGQSTAESSRNPQDERRDSASYPDRRPELITTIINLTPIFVVGLFFAFVVDFSVDSARFALVVMVAALVVFFSGGLRSS